MEVLYNVWKSSYVPMEKPVSLDNTVSYSPAFRQDKKKEAEFKILQKIFTAKTEETQGLRY